MWSSSGIRDFGLGQLTLRPERRRVRFPLAGSKLLRLVFKVPDFGCLDPKVARRNNSRERAQL
jgi:hypothetical protein